jgi:hypothetical protein
LSNDPDDEPGDISFEWTCATNTTDTCGDNLNLTGEMLCFPPNSFETDTFVDLSLTISKISRDPVVKSYFLSMTSELVPTAFIDPINTKAERIDANRIRIDFRNQTTVSANVTMGNEILDVQASHSLIGEFEFPNLRRNEWPFVKTPLN